MPRNLFHRLVTLPTRYPLASILSLTFACWLPNFSSRVVPYHDSAYLYECFHTFYSDALFTGELTRWLPYGNYGMQADMMQCAVLPTAEAVSVAGLLFRSTDSLLLFKIAILLNEALYAFGLYLLSKELYSQKLTRFLVVLTGVLSVSWVQQAFLNLNVFYLLPLVLCCLVRFFKTGNVLLLFLAGLVEICSIIGGVPYFAPLHALILAIVVVALCCQYPHSLRALARPGNLVHPGLWGMVVAAAVIVGVLSGGLENLTSLVPDRDSATGRVTLDTFLNYGRLSIGTTIFGFVTGGIPHGDNTYYVGLLSLAFFTYALITSGDKVFLGIASVFGALCWLQIGGVFAAGVFLFPGMGLFRHIGLVFGIASLFLLLGAGFGIDRLACLLAGCEAPPTARRRDRCCWLGLLVALMCADLWFWRRPFDRHALFHHAQWLPFFAFRLLVCLSGTAMLLGLYRARKSWPGYGTLAAQVLAATCLLDMASFRAQVYWTLPYVLPADVPQGVFDADRIPYLAERSQQPPSGLAAARWRLATRQNPYRNNVHYTMVYEFVRMDPCRPIFRLDVLGRGTFEMFQARGAVLDAHPADDFFPPRDEGFKASVGCNSPKVRLVRRVHVARTESEAKRLFAALSDPASTVVLLSEDAQIAALLEEDESESPGTVQVTGFTSNRIDIEAVVNNEKPAWLVYADSWHPGWSARVDGRDVPIVRANLGFKAVRVDPGAHKVQFTFQPRLRTALAWCHLLIATAFGLVLCFAMAAAVVQEFRNGP